MTPVADAAPRMAGARISLVVTGMGAGGAERVMSILANAWAAAGCHVTLITFSAPGNDFYALHPAVQRVGLDVVRSSATAWAGVRNTAWRVRRLRNALRASSPDAVVSFITKTNVLALLAGAGQGWPTVVSERSDPASAPLAAFWRALRRTAYPRAAAVVLQTPAAAAWARGFLPAARVHVIPNPVTPPACMAPAAPGPGRVVLGLGRLGVEKGFDLLIRAFARCAPSHPQWRLHIAGEGQERGALQELAARLGVAPSVSLPGTHPSASQLLAGADLFVMPSRTEGFPNALLEAMAHGRAVISTDCRSGPGDIVRDGVDGILVPTEDVDALAAAMDTLMGDDARRARLGQAARGVLDRFSLDRTLEMWNGLLHAAMGERAGGGSQPAGIAAR